MRFSNNPVFLKSRMDSFYPLFEADHFEKGYFGNIEPVLNIIPDMAVEGFIFETTLDDEKFFPDFSLHFNKEPAIGEVLAGSKLHLFPADLFENAVWKNLKIFWEEWFKTGSPLGAIINQWLEFDLTGPLGKHPVPNVFIKIETARLHDWITDIALPVIRGSSPPAPVIRNLKRLFEALPENTRVSQLGLMLARQPESIRVYLKNFPGDSLAAFLEKIHFSGSIDRAACLFTDLAATGMALSLQMDIGPAIGPVIAIECKHSEYRKLTCLLTYLTNKKRCVQSKAGLIMGWEKRLPLISLGATLDFIKYISHLKVVLKPDHSLQAKVYLGVYYTEKKPVSL